MRLKQYAAAVKNYSMTKLNKHFEERLKEEIDKWSQFMCDSSDIKRELDKKGILIKSASTPQLLYNFELDMPMGDNLLIEQF